MPIRWPTCFDGPARAVAHDIKCNTAIQLRRFECVVVAIRQTQLRSHDASVVCCLGCINYDALCKCRIKALVPLWVYSRQHSCRPRLRQHDVLAISFVPRTERPVQNRGIGPDRGLLQPEGCSEDKGYMGRSQTGGEDCCCCCCRVGSRRQKITAYTGVILYQ